MIKKIFGIAIFITVFLVIAPHSVQAAESSLRSYPTISGDSVTDVGDINHDGFDDAAVLSNHNLYYGKASGTNFSIPDTTINIPYIKGINGKGDVNGDGYDDLILNTLDKIFLFYGGPNLPKSLSTSLADVSVAVSGYMKQVSIIGDVNGDDCDDIIYYDLAGHIYVIYGGANLPSAMNLPNDTNVTLTVSSHFNYPIHTTGDINHDGYEDLVVMDNGIYVVFGSNSLSDTVDISTAYNLKITSFTNKHATRLSSVGDLSGDNVDDLVVVDDNGIYIFNGRTDLAGTVNTSNADQFIALPNTPGTALLSNIDMTGDGRNDLIIGDPYTSSHDHLENGQIYLIPGGGTTITQTWYGSFDGARVGMSLNSIDLTSDGQDDLLVGSRNDSPIIISTTDHDADGVLASMGDCDDINATVFPDAVDDSVDGLDNDCDNKIDEDYVFSQAQQGLVKSYTKLRHNWLQIKYTNGDVQSLQLPNSTLGNKSQHAQVAPSSDGLYAIIVPQDGRRVTIIDNYTGAIISQVTLHRSQTRYYTRLAISGNHIVAATPNRRVVVISLLTWDGIKLVKNTTENAQIYSRDYDFLRMPFKLIVHNKKININYRDRVMAKYTINGTALVRK